MSSRHRKLSRDKADMDHGYGRNQAGMVCQGNKREYPDPLLMLISHFILKHSNKLDGTKNVTSLLQKFEKKLLIVRSGSVRAESEVAR